jgi:hypothetical protein
MNASERIAKLVVETVLPGSKMSFRTSQSTSTHDFDLITPAGLIAALEVTSAADPKTLRTEAAILDSRKGGSLIPRTKSTKDWYINPTIDANINQVRTLADEYLAEIEKEGIEEFYSVGDSFSSPAVTRIWTELSVEAGTVLKWNPPGFIGLALPGVGGWLNPYQVHSAVRAEAGKQDNLDKLIASGAPERHLFVYVDPSHALPWMCLREMQSGVMPVVPSAITYLWACAPYDRTIAVLHGPVSGGWWERAPSVTYVPGAV